MKNLRKQIHFFIICKWLTSNRIEKLNFLGLFTVRFQLNQNFQFKIFDKPKAS